MFKHENQVYISLNILIQKNMEAIPNQSEGNIMLKVKQKLSKAYLTFSLLIHLIKLFPLLSHYYPNSQGQHLIKLHIKELSLGSFGSRICSFNHCTESSSSIFATASLRSYVIIENQSCQGNSESNVSQEVDVSSDSQGLRSI